MIVGSRQKPRTAAHSILHPTAGYSAAYAQLHNAAKAERDALPEVRDARADLAARLGALAASSPGRLPRLVAAHVPAGEQQLLASLMLAAGVSIA